MTRPGLRVKSSIRNGAATGTEIRNGVPTSKPRVLAARPTCAVCDKPEEEGFLDRFVVFTARCHGQSERVRVELEVLADGRVNFGLAFVPSNRLPAPAVRGLLGPGGRSEI